MSKYLVLTREDIQRLTYELADLVREKYEFDVIVGVARGGWIPARLLSDLLNRDYVGTIRIRFYSDVGKTLEEPIIEQDLSIEVKDKRVLLVDDVADTGKSLKVALNRILEFSPKEVKIAVYHVKPRSEIIPDFYVEATDKRIVYPWEYAEFVRHLVKKYGDEGKALAISLGIPKRIIDFLRFFPDSTACTDEAMLGNIREE